MASRLLLPVLALVGCSTGQTSVLTSDSGGDLSPGYRDGRPDRGLVSSDAVPTDTTPLVTTITCAGDCRDYVLNRLLLPDATTKTIDLDGDGNPDNALGGILAALAAAVPSMTLQEDLDTSVFKGSVLTLVRIQAPDFADAGQALAQVWRGEEQTCCTSTNDPAKCKAEASKSCYSGSHTFKVHPTNPNSAVMGGGIHGGKAAFGPANMTLTLSISSLGAVQFDMIGVRLQGDVVGTGIQAGLLAGAIPQSELDNNLVPTIATMLDDELKDPGTSPSTKATITSLFDGDNDGSISHVEVKNNALVQTFLAGDVDVNGDGVKELSLGLGFQAVQAIIDG